MISAVKYATARRGIVRSALLISALAVTCAASAQSFPSFASGIGTTGSAEAQLRIYRALTAAADDTANQLREHIAALGGTPSFILYDPRILIDLLVYQGFRTQLDALDARLRIADSTSTGLALTAPGLISAASPDPDGLSLLLSTLRATSASVNGHTNFLDLRSQAFLKTSADDKSYFDRYASIPNAGPTYNPTSPGVSPPLAALLSGAGVSATSPAGSGGAGGAGGAGGVASPTQPASGATTTTTGTTATGSVPFFPQTLSTIAALITSLPATAAALWQSGSMSNGVSGPTLAESFVVGRIAKRLPGAYTYPSFVPVQSDDNDNPLNCLFKQQLRIHDDVTSAQAKLREFLKLSLTNFRSQFQNDSYWPIPVPMLNVLNQLPTYIKSPLGAPATLTTALADAKDALSNDPLLTGDPQKKLQSELATVAADISSGDKFKTKTDSISLVKALRKAQKQFSFKAPDAVNTLATDITAIINPIASVPSSGQVLVIQNDLANARGALVTAGFPPGQLANSESYIDLFGNELSKATNVFDPMIALMQVLDAAVGSLNTAAALPAAGTPAAPAGTTAAVTTAPPQPGAGSGTDTFATVLLRGYGYRKTLDGHTKILRVVVEMSFATDRMDSFGLNLPSRKSSSAAELSYSLFGSDGKIEVSGSSLAYLPTAGAGDPLGGKAEIMRDEPESEIYYEKPAILVEADLSESHGGGLRLKIVARHGKSSDSSLKDCTFSWRLLDGSGKEITDADGSPSLHKIDNMNWDDPKSFSLPLLREVQLESGKRYTIIIESTGDDKSKHHRGAILAKGESSFVYP